MKDFIFELTIEELNALFLFEEEVESKMIEYYG